MQKAAVAIFAGTKIYSVMRKTIFSRTRFKADQIQLMTTSGVDGVITIFTDTEAIVELAKNPMNGRL